MKSIIVLHVHTLNDLADIVLIIKIDLFITMNGLLERASYRQIHEIYWKIERRCY